MTWTVHLGDCLDPVSGLASLPDKSVDHVICDPPYEAEAHTKARRAAPGSNSSKAFAIAEHEIDFAPITEADRALVAAHCVRVSRGWVLAFCQVEAVGVWRSALESAGAAWRRALAWVKPDGTPQFAGDRPAQGFECMSLAWAGDGRSRWNGGGRRGVYEECVNNFGRLTGGRPHPTQKPLALMEALIRDFTDPGETILDPFAGSGTTGVACRRLGRNFIGWERDPKYHAIAVKRIGQAREQLRMFDVASGGDR